MIGKKPRQAPEKKFMWQLKRNLELIGFDVTLFAQPFRARQTRGVPDMYIRHRKYKVRLWVECKTGRVKLNPFQEHWIGTEQTCGGSAIVAYSMDDVLNELRRLGCPIS